MIKNFIARNRTIISYGFFGVLTTLINILTYQLFYECFSINNIASNILAWVIAVVFAFVTNKIYVFKSNDKSGKTLTREISTFLFARLATGLLDLLIMFLAVNVFEKKAIVFKVISNIIVIISNYIFSKLLVFKESKSCKEQKKDSETHDCS